SASPLTVVPVEPERKGQPLLAWLVIGGLVGLIIWLQTLRSAKEEADVPGQASLGLGKIQGRYLVGAGDLFGNREACFPQAHALNNGAMEQRLIFVTVVGELGGPEKALEQLQDLHVRIKNNHVEPTEPQSDLMGTLRRLYRDFARRRFDAPS